jgi:hypothetical protein
MIKRIIECLECGNGATVYTASKEEVGFCSFCGEPIVIVAPETDDDSDIGVFDRDEEDENWLS